MKWVLLLTEIILFLIGMIRMRRDRDIFNPFLLFSVPLLVSLIVNLLYYDPRYGIEEGTYFVYFISVVAFSIGLFVGVKTNVTVKIRSIKSVSKPIYIFIWLFTIISSVFAVYQIIKGFHSGIYGTELSYLINNVRYYTQYVDEGNFFSIYGQVTADVLMLLLMYRYFVLREQTEKKKMLLAILFYALFTATVFNRTAMLYCVCAIAFFYSQQGREYIKKQKKIALVVAILFVLAILVFNYIAINTNKGTIGSSADPWLVFYFGSEFYWLQKFALSVGFHTYGTASLGIIGRLFYKLGLLPVENVAKYSELLRASGNPVSSFVAAPYLDFGYLGVFILLLCGFIYGFIYRNHRKKGDVWTLFYATCVYPLVVAFYSFQFGLSSQVYVFVILIMMGRKRLMSNNKNEEFM